MNAISNPARSVAADAILQGLSTPTYATDASGYITYFNEAAAQLWGRRPSLGETRWCGAWKLFTSEGAPLAPEQSPLALCISQNKALRNVEVLLQRPDGVRRAVAVNPSPLRAEDGALVGAVGTIIDLSDARTVHHALEAAQMFTRQILANSPDCIKVLDLEGRLQSINQCGCYSLEVDDPEKAKGVSYYEFWESPHDATARAAAKEAFRSGVGTFVAPYTSPSGRRTLWEEMISVIRDPAGEATGLLVISRDITERVQIAEEQQRRLSQQRAVAEFGAFALEEEDFQAVMQRAVEIAANVLQVPLTKILRLTHEADRLLLQAGVGWQPGLVGAAHVGVDRDSQAGYTLISDDPVVVTDLAAETRFSGPPLLRDHGVRSGLSVKIAGAGDRPFGVFGVHTREHRTFDQADVDFLLALANVVASRARQADAQERRQLLVREMSHRAGNVLQVTAAIFDQTLRSNPDLDLAKQKFSARLKALSRANLLLTSGGWGDAPLALIVRDTLEPFLRKVQIEGRDIVLPSDLCFDLSLVLHELSTNSAKYGAFSREEGLVRISWSIEGPANGTQYLRLTWSDTSEPVESDKKGTGFGAKLLSQLIERKWGGVLQIENTPHYVCAMRLPLPRVG